MIKLTWKREKNNMFEKSVYVATAAVKVDDAIEIVKYELEPTECGKAWNVAVTIDGERSTDETYTLLRDAKKDAVESASRGFKWVSGLGYCLR